ncbi:MAG TPA: response regulator, partial [Phycisphaerae bacterium]|nr:response regulator [Phycisphaerae bacterium]
MAEKLRACLFNAAADTADALRQAFAKLADFQVLGDTAEWEELRDWVRNAEPDLVAVYLDDEAAEGQHIVEKLAQFAPGTPVLGVSGKTDPAFIIAAMRAGCSQFVPWPIDAADLANATDRIRATRKPTIHNSKRICVIGSSGGVGATAIACNLAMEFGGMTERPAALVDLNLEFGDVGCAFDCAPKYTIADVCRDGVDIDPHMLEAAIHELPCHVALMVRPEDV